MTINPRYLAYARAHGRRHGEQLRADDEAWPGGCMAGFILWVQRRWQEWAQAEGHETAEAARALPDADERFDRWLGRWRDAERLARTGGGA